MMLGQLSAWPPPVTDETGRPLRTEGVLERCELILLNSFLATHLELTIAFRSRQYKVIYWHTSEAVLRRIESTLRSHPGITLDQSCALELMGFHED